MGQKYDFHFKTGSESGSGTDSNIYIILHGEFGTTEEIRVNPYIRGNAFEREKDDYCTIEYRFDVGRVFKISLRSDCTYAGAAWLLSYMEVSRKANAGEEDLGQNLVSYFPVNSWISTKNTKEFMADYTTWEKHFDYYKTTEVPYKTYKLVIPAKTHYVYQRTEEYETKFEYENIDSKKTTKEFNVKFGANKSFEASAELFKGLTAKSSSSGFVEFAFKKGFEHSELNRLTKTETRKLTEVVKHDFGIADYTREFEIVFNLIKVEAIAKTGRVITRFEAVDDIKYVGARQLNPPAKSSGDMVLPHK